MGSPLKRMSSWGFPEIFASPTAIHSTLAGMLPAFRWINVNRPFDLIGGAISDGITQTIGVTRWLSKKLRMLWPKPLIAMWNLLKPLKTGRIG
jgi:hypothetical protein